VWPKAGRFPVALDRLIELSKATKKPDEVTKWRAERANYPSPNEVAPPPKVKSRAGERGRPDKSRSGQNTCRVFSREVPTCCPLSHQVSPTPRGYSWIGSKYPWKRLIQTNSLPSSPFPVDITSVAHSPKRSAAPGASIPTVWLIRYYSSAPCVVCGHHAERFGSVWEGKFGALPDTAKEP